MANTLASDADHSTGRTTQGIAACCAWLAKDLQPLGKMLGNWLLLLVVRLEFASRLLLSCFLRGEEMKPKSKTVWEQWVEKVEAAWPVTATEIAKLCDCDHKTATRIRDHIAQARQEEPPRASGGLRPVQVDDAIVDEIAKGWPVSLKEIMRRYNRGKTVARRLQKAAISRHELEANQSIAKQSATTEEAFKRLDEYVAQHGKTRRDEMRAYAQCSWSTITAWRKARGIYEPAFATAKKRSRIRAASGIASEPMQRPVKPVPIVPAKPQHYAPGRWFRSKRSGEIVPALFCVSGNEVKFFARAE